MSAGLSARLPTSLKITTYRVGLALGAAGLIAALWPMLFPFRLTAEEATACFDDRIEYYVELLKGTALTGSDALPGEAAGPPDVVGAGHDHHARWRAFYAASVALERAVKGSPKDPERLSLREVSLLLDQPGVREALDLVRVPEQVPLAPPPQFKALLLYKLGAYLAARTREAELKGLDVSPLYRYQVQLSVDMVRRGDIVLRKVGTVALPVPPSGLSPDEGNELYSILQSAQLSPVQGVLTQILGVLRRGRAAASEPNVSAAYRGQAVHTMMKTSPWFERLIEAATMDDVAARSAIYDEAERWRMTLPDEGVDHFIYPGDEHDIARHAPRNIDRAFGR